MQSQGKIQKWGNSASVRIPARVLASSGISIGDDVDIQASEGCLVIQLHGRTQEQALDKLLASEQGATELLALAKDSLSKVISLTDETAGRCYSLIEKLEQKELF